MTTVIMTYKGIGITYREIMFYCLLQQNCLYFSASSGLIKITMVSSFMCQVQRYTLNIKAVEAQIVTSLCPKLLAWILICSLGEIILSKLIQFMEY